MEALRVSLKMILIETLVLLDLRIIVSSKAVVDSYDGVNMYWYREFRE